MTYILFFLYLVLASTDRKVLLQSRIQCSELNIGISRNIKTLLMFISKQIKEEDRSKTDVRGPL